MTWTLVAQLLILGLAAGRLTALVVLDSILDGARARVFVWSPPVDGLDDHDLAMYAHIDTDRWGRRTGHIASPPRQAGFAGRLLACHHCAGVWVSVLVYIAWRIAPDASLPVLAVAAVAQVSDIVIEHSR